MEKIKYIKINTSITICYKNKKFSWKFSETEAKAVIRKIKNYNELPLKDTLNHIIEIFVKNLSNLLPKDVEEIKQKQKEVAKTVKAIINIEKVEKSVVDKLGDKFEQTAKGIILKGFDYPLPDILLKRLLDFSAKGEDITPLINFWLHCLQNPNEQARNDLFKFCKNHNFTITPNGFLLCFRQLEVKGKRQQGNKLEKFINNSYLKVKKQKKSPKNYKVYDTGDDYTISDNTPSQRVIGNLLDLYLELGQGKGTTYTDAHTKTFNISIPSIVSMPRENCDEDHTTTCSAGLHVGSPQFVNSNNFGDTIVACLVNPRNVVSVPYSDAHKMRCCEYYVFATVSSEDVEDFAKENSLLFDEDYLDIDTFKLMEGVDIESLKSQKLFSRYTELQTQLTQSKASLQSIMEAKKINKPQIAPINKDQLLEIIKARI